MTCLRKFLFWSVAIVDLLAACAGLGAAERPSEETAMRSQAQQLQSEGNFREALTLWRRLTLEVDSPDAVGAAQDAVHAVENMQQLGEFSELDDYLDAVATRFAANWRVQAAIGRLWLEAPHDGFLIGRAFRRGPHRGGGQVANVVERDRVRSLQRVLRAVELVPEAEQGLTEASELLERLADALMFNRQGNLAWQLQNVTDLDRLPDAEAGWAAFDPTTGAPVDGEGRPVVYRAPGRWEDAASDGERWRFALAQRTRWQPALAARELLQRAQFQNSQFGVETLAGTPIPLGREGEEEASSAGVDGRGGEEKPTGIFALSTLSDEETIAKLATGVARFKLANEFHPIALLRAAADAADRQSDERREALTQLAAIFENRRHYSSAAEIWRRLADERPKEPYFLHRWEQIVKPWGRLEPTSVQSAGRGATFELRHRNAKRVEFTAHAIDVRKLLDDVKTYLSSRPKQLDWDRLQIDNLGYRLVVQNESQYVGEQAAAWRLDLAPREGHFDRRTTVAAPLQNGGAYLITARIDGGNEQRIVLWEADTALLKKNLGDKSLYYAADALTGAPLEKLHVELFGFQQREAGEKRFQVDVQRFAEFTNADGIVQIDVDEAMRGKQWIATATDKAGRFAYLGYSGFWSGEARQPPHRQVKAFAVSDRPVYRPGHKVQFKFWVCDAHYELAEASQFAHQSFQVEIRDPRNEKTYSQLLIADAYGGLAGTWEIPTDATLGFYRFDVVNHGGGSFRVEEYKKPEFEATVEAPTKPIPLGEAFRALVRAQYYFGSPVTQGKVRYKVLRTAERERWLPVQPWDWLYGAGYGLLQEDYPWYPQWRAWGTLRRAPWWGGSAPSPPELIAAREIPLGPDGTAEIEIDTSLARQFFPDDDHRYRIEVEVVDASRRMVAASGAVIASRRPAQVHVSLDRGYYRSGDTMQVRIDARTPGGEPVSGKGTLRLMRISYRDAQPIESAAAQWDLPTNAEGEAALQITAAEPGQYRVSYELRVAPLRGSEGNEASDGGETEQGGEKQRVEGAQIVTIRGPDFDGRSFRFNAIEIVPERREYAVGDKVALQVSVDRAQAGVLLFIRPENGAYSTPQFVRMAGKSTLVEIEVKPGDAPNFFVEGVTVHGGQCHTDVSELFVPPASRILNVEASASASAYQPGEKVDVRIKLTDAAGRPFVGSTVIAVYDKALDAIAGNEAIPDIREFFWKWRRRHIPTSETNLERIEWPIGKPNEPQMESIGIFGESVADEEPRPADLRQEAAKSMARQGMAQGGMAQDRGVAGLGMAPMAARAEEADSAAPAPTAAGGLAEPKLRRQFADTALWVASLETNAEGTAVASCDAPENLTAWRVRAWAMGRGTRVGQGAADFVTRKNVLVRLQVPRFVVEGDEVTLSANVHNYLPNAKSTRVRLAWQGDQLELASPGAADGGTKERASEQTVDIPADGEVRVDWRLRVRGVGPIVLQASALTDVESDAMQLELPALVHGMEKTDSYTGSLRRGESSARFQVVVPQARKPELSRLEVRFSPTLAGAIVDAIPYLIDYPYGCTEQTLNRFVPAVIAQRTLQRMQVNLAEIQAKRTNSNAQQLGEPAERAAQWRQYDRNPVFSEEELSKAVRLGVNRLAEMQLADGGWGWFSGWGERSTPHMTAVVVHGLTMARQNDVALLPQMLERGTAWLAMYEKTQLAALDNWDREANKSRQEQQPAKSRADELDALVLATLAEHNLGDRRMRDYVYQDRTALAPYALATLGLALHRELENAEAGRPLETDPPDAPRPAPADPAARQRLSAMRAMVLRNLTQFLRQDDENQTSWLELPAASWWHWYGSEYETHAYYLKLLSAVEPESVVAPRLVKYLLNNRRQAARWNSTRDTALVVEALADYLRASGENRPQLKIQALVDGKIVKEVDVSAENLFSFDNRVVLAGETLATGAHTVELRTQGTGPLYYSGWMTNFTLEDPIEATGLELKVTRRYYKLSPLEDATTDGASGRGKPLQLRAEKWERTPLVDGMAVASGDLIEAELLVESKNDYEYVVFEDPRPAGFETLEVRSGYDGNPLGAYRELRDHHAALFVERLARGRHSVAYRLRAESPGRFSALPTRASAMYAPELRANAAEFKAQVEEGE